MVETLNNYLNQVIYAILMVDREQVYELVKLKGPLIPSEITSQLKSSTIFIGAYLSELHAQHKVFITNVKRGGSPFYYVPEQREKLQNLRDHLNEKDRRTFDLLQEKKVLADDAVEPLTRVSLRNIKDFAVPLQVTINDQEKLFWKWYLLSNEEVQTLLKELFEPVKEKIIPSSEQPLSKEVSVQEPVTLLKKSPPKKAPRKIKQEKLIAATPPSSSKEILHNQLQQDLVQDPLLEQVGEFFKKNNIYILHYTILKKKCDIEFFITVPSPVGGVEYYCRARSKKTNNENDLAMVYIIGEAKKLPVLYLTTGEVTKKALNQLPVMFKNLKVKQLGGKVL